MIKLPKDGDYTEWARQVTDVLNQQGECDCICHTHKLPIKRSPEHFCCKDIDLPEQEEWEERLKEVWDEAYKIDPHYCFASIRDHVRDNFISRDRVNKIFKPLIYVSKTPETLSLLVHLRNLILGYEL